MLLCPVVRVRVITGSSPRLSSGHLRTLAKAGFMPRHHEPVSHLHRCEDSGDTRQPLPYMRVRLSRAFLHTVLRLDEGDVILGSGAVLHRSNSCVTLHTVEAAWPRTRMPHARGVAPVRRNPPETRRHEATKEEDGRASRIAADGDAVLQQPRSFLRRRHR